MTSDQINIAICKLLGWTNIEKEAGGLSSGYTGIDPKIDGQRLPITRFTDSVDAMYEAEKTLSDDEKLQYVRILHPARSLDFYLGDFALMHTSALARACAFLAVKKKKLKKVL